MVSEIDPGILESAADRIAAELPEFMTPQADRLAAALAAALIEAGLGNSPERFPEPDRAEPPFPIARNRRLLEAAFEQGKPVEIEYYVASRSEWTTRHVAISDVYEKKEEWYLSGQCGLRQEYRHFRLDHIRAVLVLDDEDHLPDPFGD
ncbi:MAG: WYL domain-containing protein [Cytophagales bacterium]|nr:WYL domain-containing protein [Armatimonadota bacterium]